MQLCASEYTSIEGAHYKYSGKILVYAPYISHVNHLMTSPTYTSIQFLYPISISIKGALFLSMYRLCMTKSFSSSFCLSLTCIIFICVFSYDYTGPNTNPTLTTVIRNVYTALISAEFINSSFQPQLKE